MKRVAMIVLSNKKTDLAPLHEQIVSPEILLTEFQQTDTEYERNALSEKYTKIKEKIVTLFPCEQILNLLEKFNKNGDDSFIAKNKDIIVSVFAENDEYAVSMHMDKETYITFEKSPEEKELVLVDYHGNEKDVYKLAEQSAACFSTLDNTKKFSFSLTG